MTIRRSQRLEAMKDDFENIIIENSPSIGKGILKTEEDLKAGRVISLDEYLSTQKG
jgi:hypothetical protein